jgi:hypothetical protein
MSKQVNVSSLGSRERISHSGQNRTVERNEDCDFFKSKLLSELR